MIAYIKGAVGELSPTEAVIEAAGVGYQLAISLNTFSALQGKETAKLYIKEVIREDTHDLFGFFPNKNARSLKPSSPSTASGALRHAWYFRPSHRRNWPT